MRAFLLKDKRRMRQHLAAKVGHPAPTVRHPRVDVKQHRKFLMRNPVADVTLGDDSLSYVPFRYVRGTLRLSRG